jgi:chromosome segregation ATPase
METAAHRVEQALTEEESLASLEERIRRTVELVSTLRAERDAAVAALEGERKTATAATAEAQRLRQELDGLRSERKQVRTRIEKLLGQMDLLTGS